LPNYYTLSAVEQATLCARTGPHTHSHCTAFYPPRFATRAGYPLALSPLILTGVGSISWLLIGCRECVTAIGEEIAKFYLFWGLIVFFGSVPARLHDVSSECSKVRAQGFAPTLGMVWSVQHQKCRGQQSEYGVASDGLFVRRNLRMRCIRRIVVDTECARQKLRVHTKVVLLYFIDRIRQ